MSDSRDVPWFLQRLALDGAADQRAIRRAYAREVKRIDQGADAEGFQLLREAYETALQWEQYQRYCAQQEADQGADAAPLTVMAPDAVAESGETGGAAASPAASTTAPGTVPVSDDVEAGAAHAAVPAAPGTAPPAAAAAPEIDPQQLSADVFEAFIAGCSALAQGRTLHDAAPWEQHIRTCLHDDRLMNLAARDIFEARIVHLLASGWRNGHETLLEAAADAFQWRSDRHRLRQFGHAGAIVDRAIDERSMFDNQEREHKAAQRQVIARLRDGELPDSQQLRADMPHVEQLVVRFPTWLDLVTSMENVELWRTAHAALPPEPQQVMQAAPDMPSRPVRKSGWDSARRAAFWLLLATAALRVLHHVADRPSTPPAATYAADRQKLDAEYDALMEKYDAHRVAREAEDARKAARTVHPAPAPQAPPRFTPPNSERVAEIRSRIRYRLTHMETPGQYRAEFNVQLDGNGHIAKVELGKPSGLPQYDAAVERAIRETAPFPPGTTPKFKLLYGMEIVEKTAAPAPGQAPNAPADGTAPESPPQ